MVVSGASCALRVLKQADWDGLHDNDGVVKDRFEACFSPELGSKQAEWFTLLRQRFSH